MLQFVFYHTVFGIIVCDEKHIYLTRCVNMNRLLVNAHDSPISYVCKVITDNCLGEIVCTPNTHGSLFEPVDDNLRLLIGFFY
jgi:hypothetical protein